MSGPTADPTADPSAASPSAASPSARSCAASIQVRGRAALRISVRAFARTHGAHALTIDDRGFGGAQLQPVALDLTADLGQQIIKNPARHQCIAEPAMGGFIRHRRMQAKPPEPHEIEPHLERAFQLRIAQPMPLPDQQALEQHQRIIALRPAPRPPTA